MDSKEFGLRRLPRIVFSMLSIMLVHTGTGKLIMYTFQILVSVGNQFIAGGYLRLNLACILARLSRKLDMLCKAYNKSGPLILKHWLFLNEAQLLAHAMA
jgi:hypothetical protein